MRYYNIYNNREENFNWLEIYYSLITKKYHGWKYIKNQTVAFAYSSTWKDFFINFTLHGLYNTERCNFTIPNTK